MHRLVLRHIMNQSELKEVLSHYCVRSAMLVLMINLASGEILYCSRSLLAP